MAKALLGWGFEGVLGSWYTTGTGKEYRYATRSLSVSIMTEKETGIPYSIERFI